MCIEYKNVIEYKKKIIALQNHEENDAGSLVPDLFLFFNRPFYEVNADDLQLSFNGFQKHST